MQEFALEPMNCDVREYAGISMQLMEGKELIGMWFISAGGPLCTVFLLVRVSSFVIG